ncbi:MAG: YqgE/AlgH family protein [Dehalococcoidia bacterium]
MAVSLKGRLLVASPALEDANFARSVVYVCAHDENGALGLILNRPMDTAPVGDHLPQWMEHVDRPAVFFQGGPVEPGAALALAARDASAPDSGWLDVATGLGLLNLDSEPGEIAGHLRSLRLFTGYSGWSAGQLEAEIKEEAWFVVDAAREDLFRAETGTLWRDVLLRQPGKLALFAYFPGDPRAN